MIGNNALIAADLGADLTIEVVARARARRDLPPDLALPRCKNTPFEGARMQGRVKLTMVNGKTVFEA